MEWSTPRYSRRKVNEAGVRLVRGGRDNEADLDAAIAVVGNFRAAHAFPLNTLQIRLRFHAHCMDKKSFVAQRLKRLSSILFKLQRFESMELWDIQDIGGCRAVVSNVKKVDAMVDAFKSSRIRHRLAHEDDYIRQPKDDGYRSRHLVYRYISDRNEVYNGFKIEIQIRTPLQHAWATTVETVDAFTQQALKASRGRRDWARFFQLMGTWMALREDSPPVPGTPTDILQLCRDLRSCANELQVEASLRGFATALSIVGAQRARHADYVLLSLDNVRELLNIAGYNRKELAQASEAYAMKEKEIRDNKGTDAVLVSVDSVRNLRRAYPNYFADTRRFASELKKAASQVQ